MTRKEVIKEIIEKIPQLSNGELKEIYDSFMKEYYIEVDIVSEKEKKQMKSRNYQAMNMILHTKPGAIKDKKKESQKTKCREKIVKKEEW